MTTPVKTLKDQTDTAFQPNVPDKVGYANTTFTVVTWGSTHTASDDGWISVYGRGKASDTMSLTIAGKVVLEVGTDTPSLILIHKTRFPIKKGDTYVAKGNTSHSTYPNTVEFFPLRTALDE